MVAYTKPVTLIITSYNQIRYLYDCIKSCLDQDYKALKLIIVDDGSVESEFPVNVIKKFIEHNKKENLLEYQIIINEVNLGTVKSLNKAVNKVTTDYFCIIGGDDYFDRLAVTKLVLMISRGNFDIVGCKLIGLNIKNEFHAIPFNNQLFFEKFNILNSVEKFKLIAHEDLPITFGGAILKTKTFNKISGFDENFELYEDRPILLKLAINNSNFMISEESILFYRDFSGISNNKYNIGGPKILKDLIYLHDKYYRIHNDILNFSKFYLFKTIQRYKLILKYRLLEPKTNFNIIKFSIINFFPILFQLIFYYFPTYLKTKKISN